MSSTIVPQPNRLRIWQQNINKSQVAQEDLINSDIYKHFDFLLLQEPYIDGYGNTKATKDWRVIYPFHHLTNGRPVRSVILANSKLDTNDWAPLSIPDSSDLSAMQTQVTLTYIIFIMTVSMIEFSSSVD